MSLHLPLGAKPFFPPKALLLTFFFFFFPQQHHFKLSFACSTRGELWTNVESPGGEGKKPEGMAVVPSWQVCAKAHSLCQFRSLRGDRAAREARLDQKGSGMDPHLQGCLSLSFPTTLGVLGGRFPSHYPPPSANRDILS